MWCCQRIKLIDWLIEDGAMPKRSSAKPAFEKSKRPQLKTLTLNLTVTNNNATPTTTFGAVFCSKIARRCPKKRSQNATTDRYLLMHNYKLTRLSAVEYAGWGLDYDIGRAGTRRCPHRVNDRREPKEGPSLFINDHRLLSFWIDTR